MKRIGILLFLVLAFFALGACAVQPVVAPTGQDMPAATALPAEEAVSGPIVLTDALGREVTLDAPPQRIVLVGRALFMIADAAYIFPGAAERIVAIADRGQGSYNFISLIDPNIDSKKGLDKDAGAEQVAPLQPDLVILKSYNAETLGAPLEALGIPVVYVDLETPEQFSRDLAILGQIFGDEARAQELVAYYEAKVAEISEKAAAAGTKPRVLLLSYNDRDGNVAFNVMPMSWIQTQMVELAGGEPVWADANPGSGSAQVTLEQIAAWDPDQIYIVAYNNDPSEVVAGLQADPNWEGIRAVQEGQLYAFPGDFYSWDQPDPRWILGLNWLATRIQPEVFADVDMTPVVTDFYDKVYGLDAAFVEENVLPAIWGDMP